MNKAELVNVMAEKAGLTKVDAKKALDAFICATTDAIRKGENVSLVGFGVFSKAVRKAHEGRNPQTGKKIKIAEKKVAKFKASAGLLK
ncbi:MAG: HU family DNA-binding protein [Bacteroidales bacterium]|nr:HU family DNA-binding protein [Bacteroidales bacterium]MBO7528735.1 HU family DNA-binding protein [Bacteroidales bacterium]MBQ3843538.1 HU family DNA-binding protein [Bacteroidales bacterium]